MCLNELFLETFLIVSHLSLFHLEMDFLFAFFWLLSFPFSRTTWQLTFLYIYCFGLFLFKNDEHLETKTKSLRIQLLCFLFSKKNCTRFFVPRCVVKFNYEFKTKTREIG